ncbi:MAG TPA: deoxyguanosinetriphosphate triphosphohydrolase [Candidatus Methanoperedens sp.]|nr:deoxyguanosinetriphosphate triphosphohydrolase [Candidatus Methanoperedens sp.]
MSIRAQTEQLERAVLHPRAARAAESLGRERPEAPCAIRTAFQRDRDRILHAKSFRRLKHKTQVFLAPRGDHYRTRLTHTLEVSQIARTVARGLRLNEDLTEAIALGHDLGHTPFGHAGEESLRALLPGGFSHVTQSMRVVERLENDGQGLNLTREVLEGIRTHSKGQGKIVAPAATLEAQVVRLADLVAYINHDIDDALRAGVIGESDLPREAIGRVGATHGERIGTMVRGILEETVRCGHAHVGMSEELERDCAALRDFLYANVYFNPSTHAEFLKATKILRDLYEHYLGRVAEMGEEYARIAAAEGAARAVGDFLAGMTDRFVVQTYERLFLPRPWHVF